MLPLGRMAADGPEVAALFWSLPRPALDDWPQADIAGWKAEVTALWPEDRAVSGQHPHRPPT